MRVILSLSSSLLLTLFPNFLVSLVMSPNVNRGWVGEARFQMVIEIACSNRENVSREIKTEQNFRWWKVFSFFINRVDWKPNFLGKFSVFFRVSPPPCHLRELCSLRVVLVLFCLDELFLDVRSWSHNGKRTEGIENQCRQRILELKERKWFGKPERIARKLGKNIEFGLSDRVEPTSVSFNSLWCRRRLLHGSELRVARPAPHTKTVPAHQLETLFRRRQKKRHYINCNYGYRRESFELRRDLQVTPFSRSS